MPGKAKTTIRNNLRQLRLLIETTCCPVESRIACAMETAVRWATKDTVGWEGLVKQAKEEAALLVNELDGE